MGKWLRRHTLGLCIGLALLLTIRCVRDSGTPAVSDSETSAPVPEDLPSVEMPSKAEATNYARQIELAAAELDVNSLKRAFDHTVIVDRMMTGIDVPARHYQSIRPRATNILKSEGSPLNEILARLREGATYRLLRVREKNGEVRAMFRMLMLDGSVNYHDMLLVRKENGDVRIGDVYTMLSGEDISASLWRLYNVLSAHRETLQQEDHVRGALSYSKQLDSIIAMGTSLRNGEPQAVVDIYHSLPETLKSDKATMILRYMAAAQLSAEEVNAAILDFRTQHPDDICVDFLSVDLHMNNGDYDRALACLNTAKDFIGDDPYIDVVKARCHCLAGHFENARAAASRAIDAEPDLIDAYWVQVTVSLESRDFAEVTRLLNLIGERFVVEIEDLTQIPEYAEYVKSPEYQEWLESQQK